ncbi:MAG: hypothetical protein HY341_00865 [Candidatus Kerfeldbacteria bacterium]|nr:hypothetical protein [Candidatus Kerfeldbacteria bacterium]
MRRRAFVIVIGLAALVVYFWPKDAGGVLCGPVCSPTGRETWERSCMGFRTRETFADAYRDRCYGLVVGERICSGRPHGSPPNTPEQILDCDYPAYRQSP